MDEVHVARHEKAQIVPLGICQPEPLCQRFGDGPACLGMPVEMGLPLRVPAHLVWFSGIMQEGGQFQERRPAPAPDESIRRVIPEIGAGIAELLQGVTKKAFQLLQAEHRVGPDIEGVVAVLFDALHGGYPGKTLSQQTDTVHRLDAGMTGADLEDAEDLVADPLARDGAEKRAVALDLRMRFPVDGETKLGGKAEGPQEPQGIQPEGFIGKDFDFLVPDGPAPTEGIDESGEISADEGIERQRHGRDSKVPPGEIVLDGGSAARGKIEEESCITLRAITRSIILSGSFSRSAIRVAPVMTAKRAAMPSAPGGKLTSTSEMGSPMRQSLTAPPATWRPRRQQEKILQELFIA